ncbi:MAG: hypothetical protein ACLTAN_04685 [Christensenellaceae bacterium]
MSVESIVERIRSDGKTEAEAILAAGKRKAEETENGAKAEAERLRRETESDVEKRAAAVAAHFAATARLDVKKIMLAARKKAVENVYAEAKKRLIDLGEEETLTLFNRLLCLYAEEGDAVIFADGFRYTEGVKLLPVFAQKKLKAVSDGAAFAGVKIDGGLYLAGKTADKDLSFDALLKADREENESQIAAELFGSPAKEKSE